MSDYENIGPPYVLLIEQAGTIFGIYCGNAPPETVVIDPPICPLPDKPMEEQPK